MQLNEREYTLVKNETHDKTITLFLVAAAFLLLRIGIAYAGLDFRTSDYNKHLSTWYDEISSMGGLPALREQVGNYGILYQFLICLMTYLPISSLAAYKVLSLIFDILQATACGMLVYWLTDGKDGERRYVAAVFAFCAALMLPTTFLNSSVWAQCDSIYTTFVVLGLLCLCKEHDAAAFLFMGVALSFKLQAVFVLPVFLFIAFVRRRLQYIALMAISWYATCIPGFLAGRSLLSPLEIYQNQAEQYQNMSMNFPSVWVLLSVDSYEKWGWITIVLTAGILAAYMLFVLYCYRGRYEALRSVTILELAVLFAWTCVEFLPCMHERYSYAVEILLLVLVCVEHRHLLCLILEEAVILMRYLAYLLDGSYVGRKDALVYLIAYMLYAYMLYRSIVTQRSLAMGHSERIS